jgi:hypothetical protein
MALCFKKKASAGLRPLRLWNEKKREFLEKRKQKGFLLALG